MNGALRRLTRPRREDGEREEGPDNQASRCPAAAPRKGRTGFGVLRQPRKIRQSAVSQLAEGGLVERKESYFIALDHLADSAEVDLENGTGLIP
jgi:hypothetical protein